MKGEVPMIDGDEYDAMTGWRRLLHWRPGERKAIKRKYNRRVRREARCATRQEVTREAPAP